jgi:hypothetical protein
MAKNNSGSGLSLTAVLFIVFIVLKLTGNITWSWWWVTSPLWIPFLIGIGLVLAILVGVIIALSFGASISDIKEKANYLINKRKEKKTNL